MKGNRQLSEVAGMTQKITDNLKSETRWLRLLFMVFFAFVGYICGMLVMLVAFIQIVHGFIMGEPNQRLLRLSYGLNRFLFHVIQFITYNSDQKPYPFNDWPDGNPCCEKSDAKE
ncbi:hypothetical protein CI610_00517 [invertebrate metagenome]|uniref:Lipase n=1 Tax=invertebrate metagenome TaxID=1711999 RepID=A0A2H9TB68_9ZZZZ